jgi:hypothetical protein
VKRTEALSIYTAMSQACDDAGSKIPVVAHKRNGRQWLVILTATDFLTILRRSELVASNNTAEEAEDLIVRAY